VHRETRKSPTLRGTRREPFRPLNALLAGVDEGEPFAELIKVGADLECDLIVVGIRGRGLNQLLFGCTAEKILRRPSQALLCMA
jgi:nucleotide-binding universal stress UspA family protein